MAAIGSSILPASSSLTSPVVLNVDLPLANTEYQVDIPAGAKHFCLQARGPTTLQIAEVSGNSSTNYFTLRQYVPYSIDSLTGSSTISLYVRSSKASQTLEVIYWM